jgi:RND family efflux transporter MFP subunit
MSEKPAVGVTELSRDLSRLRIPEQDAPSAPTGRRRGRTLVRWIIGLALLGALGAGAARFAPGINAELQAPEVKLVAVAMRDTGVPPVVLTAVGYVVPRRQITVSSNAQGKIVEMPVAENQRVEKDALLARLDSDEFQAALRLAEAQAADAKRELDLITELFLRGVRGKADVDRLESAYRIAAARVEQTRVLLGNTVIRAPFSGTIIRKIRDVGEFLTLGVTAQGDPGTAVVTLADLTGIEVELEVSETEIGKVDEGMVALVIPEARPDRRYLAEVIEVAAQADRRKAVVGVRVDIRDPDSALLPDMTAKVRFLSEEPRAEIRSALAVPRTAIVNDGSGPAVFLVDQGKAKRMPVELARAGSRPAPPPSGSFSARSGGPEVAAAPPAADPFVELTTGPPEGAFVIDSPPAKLVAGSPVRIAP